MHRVFARRDPVALTRPSHAGAGALPRLPFGQGRFNLVYCFSTLLLLSRKDQETAVRDMASLLAPGGFLILDIAGSRSLAIRYWRHYYRKRSMNGVFGHSAKQTRLMIQDNGLEIVFMEPHGVLSQFLLLPSIAKIPGLVRRIRGRGATPGWDAKVSLHLPGLAERWYVVARRPDAGTN